MLRRNLSFVLFVLCSFSAFAQSKEWVWLNGSITRNNFGNYSGYGMESGNPGARQGAVSWRDKNGHFWMFGGYGFASYGSAGYLNDLWMFNTTTRKWVWWSGNYATNATGVYGTKGTEGTTTVPGGRTLTTAFMDAAGNLYICGGYGYNSSSAGYLNDLWKFNMTTKKWTWIAGDNSTTAVGSYGVKGTAAGTNKPGGRQNAAGTTDSDGNFWLYGGQGYPASSTTGVLSDLWKFNVSTGMWTWVSGENTTGVAAVFGTKNTAATTNKMGSRTAARMWTDASNNVIIYGGVNLGRQADMWKYNPVSGLWTWINGSSSNEIKGTYSSLGNADAANQPGSRYDYAITKDLSGENIYMYGGNGVVNTGSGMLSDIWKYNNATNLWTWVAGNSAGNNYSTQGTQGTSASTNLPSARYGNVAWFTGNNLWVFGGYGYTNTSSNGQLNDMWGYVPASGFTLPVLFEAFTALKQANSVLLNWSTAQESNSAYFAIERAVNGSRYDSIGKVTAAGDANVLSKYAFTDRVPLSGSSYYRLKQVDKDGRSMYSKTVTVNGETGSSGLSVLINPVQQELKLAVELEAVRTLQVQVKNAQGGVVISRQQTFGKGKNAYSVSVGQLVAGTYYVSVTGEGVNMTRTFIRQ